ncbi:MAG: hypothetical protein R3266_05735, partial [Gemmatimonadota bacterium]|nr:hypothetical protein [Gemmatimonadota bacterium]
SEAPLVAVELRPPRSGLTGAGAMDMWIALSYSIRRIVDRDAFLMLTDSAIGQEEEENLQHLAANLAGEVDPWRIVPFLTCKHPLEYCLRYGDRARARGLETLTVVGGDAGGGPPRCLPHAHELRERLRGRTPELALGGWVNPHRSAEEQLGYALDPRFEADYYLTQVVSHHDLDLVERWLRATSEGGLELPWAAGVFFYRNGRRATLERLSGYFPVPVDAVASEFEAGTTPERHCARTIVELRRLGVPNVYVCNLGARHGATRYDAILSEVEALGA